MRNVRQRAIGLSAIVCCALLFAPHVADAQVGEGEQLFKQICVACHTIGAGTLIGPDLANVSERRPEEWILRFVKSSQSVVKSGDPYAVELFEKFNKIPMPDNNYADAQIRSIIEYIAASSPHAESGGDATRSSASEAALRAATRDDILAGQALFTGRDRFENGGPTCISCHNVKHDGVMAGGALAKDLTDAYTRLSGAGVSAIIGNSPFPSMRTAFGDRALTEEEVFRLTAFLQFVDSEVDLQHGRRYGTRLFFSGLGGAILLIGLLSGAWLAGKRRSVNHTIYARQVKSAWENPNDSTRNG